MAAMSEAVTAAIPSTVNAVLKDLDQSALEPTGSHQPIQSQPVRIGPFSVFSVPRYCSITEDTSESSLCEAQTSSAAGESWNQDRLRQRKGPPIATDDVVHGKSISESNSPASPSFRENDVIGGLDSLQWEDLFNWDVFPLLPSLSAPGYESATDATFWIQPEDPPFLLEPTDVPEPTDVLPLTSGTHTNLQDNRNEPVLHSDTMQSAPALLTYFEKVVVHSMSSLPIYEKSPWSTMHIPCAIVTMSKLLLFRETITPINHASLSNLYGLLAVAAYHLSLNPTNSGELRQSEGFWTKESMILYGAAKSHLELSIKDESTGEHQAKYKEQLMALSATLATSFVSNNEPDAERYLEIFEHVTKSRGLLKLRWSNHARLLHRLYAWTRIVAESTRVSPRVLTEKGHRESNPNATNAPSSHQPEQRTASKESIMDAFFRLSPYSIPPPQEGYNLTGILPPEASGLQDDECDSDDRYLHKKIYGIPETWLHLLSQTTRLANAMEYQRRVNDDKLENQFKLQSHAGQLENAICKFRSKCLQSNSHTPSAHNHMLIALNAALLIYFYRRISRIHSMILQSTVLDVISALKDYDLALVKQGLALSGTAWPAFLAGCEADSRAQRDDILAWIDARIAVSGFGNYRVAKEIMLEVWERRARFKGLPSEPPTWMEVCRDKARWPVMC